MPLTPIATSHALVPATLINPAAVTGAALTAVVTIIVITAMAAVLAVHLEKYLTIPEAVATAITAILLPPTHQLHHAVTHRHLLVLLLAVAVAVVVV